MPSCRCMSRELQPTGKSISGHTAVREVLSRSLLLDGQMNLQLKGVFQAGDLALLMSTWQLKGEGSNGRTSRDVRRNFRCSAQAKDGSWLLVINIPHGSVVAG
jgi:ketosteroid isomerase-like protein